MKLMTYIGRCTCGAVGLKATGSPEVMGYCHCESCRSWSAAPVTAFTIWKADAVSVTSGAEHVRTFLGLVDIFAPTLPTLEFEPALHIHYAETALPIRDGLPKLKDLPAEVGGSGEMIAE